MTVTLNPTCPLCGLRFASRPLLDLHVREDHRAPDPTPDGLRGSTATRSTHTGLLVRNLPGGGA